MPEEAAALDEHAVARRLGMGVNTLRRLIEDGEFPAGIQVSARIKVWVEMDVVAYLHLKSRLAASPKRAPAANDLAPNSGA